MTNNNFTRIDQDESPEQPVVVTQNLTWGFSVRSTFDPATDRYKHEYFLGERRAIRVPIDARSSRHLAGWMAISSDLASASTWLATIGSMTKGGDPTRTRSTLINPSQQNIETARAFFVAAVSFYGKCCTKGHGREVTLSRTDLSLEFRELHDDCMGLRHNYAAHHGSDVADDIQVVAVLSAELRPGTRLTLGHESKIFDLAWPRRGNLTLFDLMRHAHQICEQKTEHLRKKISNEEIMSRAHVWYAPINPCFNCGATTVDRYFLQQLDRDDPGCPSCGVSLPIEQWTRRVAIKQGHIQDEGEI